MIKGFSNVEKSGAGGCAGSGSSSFGHEISSGSCRPSCGVSSDAVCAFGIWASAEVKSSAVGVVRLPACIDIEVCERKRSMSRYLLAI